MPTKRRRLSRMPDTGVSPALVYYFVTGELPPHGDEAREDLFDCYKPEAEQRRVWERVRSVIIAEHVSAQPGTRPWAWWRWEAPRMNREQLAELGVPRCQHDEMPDPRRLVSGEGRHVTALYPAVLDSFSFGEPHLVAHKGARLRIESEASYLKRHGLLTPDERRRLQPVAFRPVSVGFEEIAASEALDAGVLS